MTSLLFFNRNLSRGYRRLTSDGSIDTLECWNPGRTGSFWTIKLLSDTSGCGSSFVSSRGRNCLFSSQTPCLTEKFDQMWTKSLRGPSWGLNQRVNGLFNDLTSSPSLTKSRDLKGETFSMWTTVEPAASDWFVQLHDHSQLRQKNSTDRPQKWLKKCFLFFPAVTTWRPVSNWKLGSGGGVICWWKDANEWNELKSGSFSKNQTLFASVTLLSDLWGRCKASQTEGSTTNSQQTAASVCWQTRPSGSVTSKEHHFKNRFSSPFFLAVMCRRDPLTWCSDKIINVHNNYSIWCCWRHLVKIWRHSGKTEASDFN